MRAGSSPEGRSAHLQLYWDRVFLNNDDLRTRMAFALSNNDWMAIALSHATGRDYRGLLKVYGLAVSEAADAHIAAKALPVHFFAADRDNYCEGLDKDTLPFDGTTSFPE